MGEKHTAKCATYGKKKREKKEYSFGYGAGGKAGRTPTIAKSVAQEKKKSS